MMNRRSFLLGMGAAALSASSCQLFSKSPAGITARPANFDLWWKPSPWYLRGRRVRVRLFQPEGAAPVPTAPWRVVVMLDGQNVLSPGGPFGSWDADVALRELATEGHHFLAIAIDNTPDRMQEYVPTGLRNERTGVGFGNEFMEAVARDLIPTVEARSGLKGISAEQRILLGSSLGGLFTFEAAHAHPEIFGTCLAFSPSFWVDRAYGDRRAQQAPETRARLYIDSGDSGTTKDGMENTAAIRDLIIASGGTLGDRFHYALGEGDGHNEAAWKKRLPTALRWGIRNP